MPKHLFAEGSRRCLLKTIGVSLFGCVLSQRGQAQAHELWQLPRSVKLGASALAPEAKGEFEYWRDGKFQMDAYLALSRLCADPHAKAAIQMDPRVFDLMFATQRWYEQVTGKPGIHQITSAYRTPLTNQKVGGAPASQHLAGRALDGRLLGLDLPTYARMLIAFGAGGVGLYKHHVHWDVGRAPRFWTGQFQE